MFCCCCGGGGGGCLHNYSVFLGIIGMYMIITQRSIESVQVRTINGIGSCSACLNDLKVQFLWMAERRVTPISSWTRRNRNDQTLCCFFLIYIWHFMWNQDGASKANLYYTLYYNHISPNKEKDYFGSSRKLERPIRTLLLRESSYSRSLFFYFNFFLIPVPDVYSVKNECVFTLL